MDVQCAAQQPATQSDSAASTTINCDIGSAMHSHKKDAALNAVQRMPLRKQS